MRDARTMLGGQGNWVKLTIALLLSSLAGIASAQSEGRIPEMATSDWRAPTFDDYAAYLREAFPRKKQADEANMKKKLGELSKLAESGKLNKVTRSRVMSKQAELLIEQADIERSEELAKYDAEYGAWLDLEPRGKEPTFSDEDSRNSILKAIQAYRSLMSSNPKTQSMPKIVHAMATALARVENENAELYYKKLLKAKGVWRGLGTLGMAEHRFDQGNFAEALKFYSKLSKAKKNVIREYAEYKEAWTQIKMAQAANKQIPPSAIATFKKLAKSSKLLRRDVHLDLVYVWSESGSVNDAKAFFSGKDVEYYYKTLERTAWKLRKQGKNLAAGKTYEALLGASKTRTYNYRTHGFFLEVLRAAGRDQQLVSVAKDMKKLYADKGSPWLKANAKRKDILERAKDKLRTNLNFYSASYHQDFRQKKQKPALVVAAELYALYLSEFTKGDEAYKLRYAYGDALNNLGRKEDAAKQYLEVVKMDNMKAKYRSSAAEQMLALQMSHVKATKFPPVPKTSQIKKPIKIPASKQLMVEILDTYVKFFPERKKSVTLKFLAGQTLMEYGHFDPAIKRLDEVVNTYNGSPESKQAVRLILDSHANRKRWDDLVAYCRNYLKVDQLGGSTIAFVKERLNIGMWEQAKALSKDNKHVPAAKAFEEFVEVFPRDDKADLALYTAANHYYKAGRGVDGIKTATQLVSRYTSSKYRANAQYTIGGVYEQLVEYERAALSYTKFAALFKGDDRAPRAMLRAAELYRDAENIDAAAKTMEVLARQFPTSNIAPTAKIRFAEYKEEAGEYSLAQRAYGDFAREYGKKAPEEALYAQAKFVSLGSQTDIDVDAMRRTLEATLVKLPRNKAEKARDVLVERMLRDFQDEYAPFSARKVGYIDFEIFSESEKQLTVDLDRIEKDYNKAIALASVKYQVAAYYRLGTQYEHALKAYEGAPRRDELTPTEAEKIASAKERASLVLKEKIQSSYQKAVGLANSAKLYTSWQLQAHRRLARLSTGNYQPIPEELMRPEVITHKISVGDSVDKLKD